MIEEGVKELNDRRRSKRRSETNYRIKWITRIEENKYLKFLKKSLDPLRTLRVPSINWLY